MAERRMLSKAIVNSGRFCRMTDKAKVLYVSLVVNADDEGAVDSFTPCLQCGSGQKELQELERNGFIATLQDGIFFIIEWELFNRVQSSRIVKSDYHERIQALSESCQQTADKTLTQYSIGKVSIVEDSTGEDDGASAAPASKRQKNNRFTPPTIEEVTAYCQERGNGIDPSAFLDYYEARGWKIGNQPMKSWQAAVRTWERRGNEQRPQKNYAPQQESTLDRLNRLYKEGKFDG